MSTLREQVDEAVHEVDKSWTQTTWSSTTTEVPDPDTMGYSDARLVQATYLYSDLLDSSGLVGASSPQEAAGVMSAFLKVAVRVIRHHNGHIRSFDGDRVMGIFAGPERQHRAVSAAMQIRGAVHNDLGPKVSDTISSLREAGWTMRAMSGVATSQALLVRAGIRGSSDLLSIGTGPNLAAKLSDLRLSDTHLIAIGAATYRRLPVGDLYANGVHMWSGPKKINYAGSTVSYYTTSYRRRIS